MNTIYGANFDSDFQNRENFKAVHRKMIEEPESGGRDHLPNALTFWLSVEKFNCFRAFLSMQSTSASAERLFGIQETT